MWVPLIRMCCRIGNTRVSWWRWWIGVELVQPVAIRSAEFCVIWRLSMRVFAVLLVGSDGAISRQTFIFLIFFGSLTNGYHFKVQRDIRCSNAIYETKTLGHAVLRSRKFSRFIISCVESNLSELINLKTSFKMKRINWRSFLHRMKIIYLLIKASIDRFH